MGKIIDSLVSMIAVKRIINIITTTDLKPIAEEFANLIDQILDNQFGTKKSEVIQNVIIPKLNEFVEVFNKRLGEN